jgi:hypothetical protein
MSLRMTHQGAISVVTQRTLDMLGRAPTDLADRGHDD